MKKAVVFDLDGTLLNTLNSICNCGNITLSHFGMQSVIPSEFVNFIGHGRDEMVKRLFKYAGGDPECFDKFQEFYTNVYNESGAIGIHPYDGIPELIDSLKSRNIKIAVFSNKPHNIAIDAVHKYFGKKFDLIFGQRSGFPLKPDPTVLYSILDKFEISKEECIYCGDSIVDVQTGKSAGVIMLGTAWGFYGDTPFSDADAVVYHPLEIIDYLDL